MTFCKNCGSNLKPGQSFCKECGAKNTESAPVESSQSRVKKTYSIPKKAWYYIIPAAVLIVAIIGAYIFFSVQFKPEKVVSNFEQAVKTKDTKTLSKMINDGQSDILVKQGDLDGYISYLTKENNFPDLEKQLERQSQEIKGFKRQHAIQDQYGNDLFILQKKSSKKWGIFNQYVVKVIPYDVYISSEYPDTTVYIKGKKIKTLKDADEKVELTKTLPGSLEVEAESKGEYSVFKTKEKVDFSEASDNVVEHQLSFDGAYVNVYSNYDDAELYINDKDTGMTVGEAESVGPLATDGSVKIYAQREFPTGMKKSQVLTVTSEDDIDLSFEESAAEKIEDPKDALEQFLNDYLYSSVSAINNGDFSYVSDKIDPDGPVYKESKDYVKYLYDKGITEENLKLEVTNYKILDANTFDVFTYEEYNIYSPAKDEDEFRAFKSEYKIKVDEYGDFKVNTLVKTKEIK